MGFYTAVAPDLQRVRQAAAGVAGVTHCVHGLMGELSGALYQNIDLHVVGHVGGHHEGGHTLRKHIEEKHQTNPHMENHKAQTCSKCYMRAVGYLF